jgi:hypothetical protein
MTAEELNKKIAAVLQDERGAKPTDYDRVVQKLRDLAQAIEASLAPGAIEVRIEPGYRVSLGQQYTFAFRIPKIGFRDVLLRAYVPPSGFPVNLDMLDDQRRPCQTLEAVEEEIIHFLGDPDVKQRLLSLKDVAA